MHRTIIHLTSLFALTALVGCASPKKLKAAYAEIDRLESEVAVLEGYRGEAMRVEDLEGMLAEARAENAEMARTLDDITSELAGFRVTGDSEIVLFHDRASLALDRGIFFATGSAQLTDEGERAVDALSRAIQKHPTRHFSVEGHTDPRPIATAEYPSNWELGAARALSVVHGLIDRGVPESQLSAVTYADTVPAIGTADYQADRRISVAFEMSHDEQLAWARAYGDRGATVAEADEEPVIDEDLTRPVMDEEEPVDEGPTRLPGLEVYVPPPEDSLDIHIP